MKFRNSPASIIAIHCFFTLIWMALFINSSEDLRPKPRLNDYMIFPSNDKFKYEILPFLSSKDLIKVYCHFQNLNPALTFENFLPPSRFYTTNVIVLDAQKPIFSQKFESPYILYQFQDDYSSLQPPILYSKKTQLLKIFEPPIFSGSIYALLSHEKIIPYETWHFNSELELLFLRDDQDGQFLITLKHNNGPFVNIASGKVSKDNFSDYALCVLKAHDLKGWEKNYWKLKYFLTIPCLKYVKYLLLLDDLNSYIDNILDSCTGWLRLKFDPCVRIFSFLNSKLYYVPLAVAYLGMLILFLKFFGKFFLMAYYKTMLPLLIVTFPLKFFIFGLNFSSFSIVEQGLITLHFVFFPHMKQYLYDRTTTLEDISNSFEIKPNNIMSVVPLLVQNKKIFWKDYLWYFLLSMVYWNIMDTFFFANPNYWL